MQTSIVSSNESRYFCNKNYQYNQNISLKNAAEREKFVFY